jgi:A/G-specific adenine glycosylase
MPSADGRREKRGMPWRKRYDPSLSMEEKGQRAYEVGLAQRGRM